MERGRLKINPETGRLIVEITGEEKTKKFLTDLKLVKKGDQYEIRKTVFSGRKTRFIPRELVPIYTSIDERELREIKGVMEITTGGFGTVRVAIESFGEKEDLKEEQTEKRELKAYETPLKTFEILKEVLPVGDRLAIFDFQAGSGNILEVFDKALLYGAEIRHIPQEERKGGNRNRVLYGVDWTDFSGEIKTLTREYKEELKKALFYLNPPYDAERKIPVATIESVPRGAPVIGLFSYRDVEELKKYIRGKIFIIPKELTGYKESNTPPKFALVVGRRKYDNKERDAEVVSVQTEEELKREIKKLFGKDPVLKKTFENTSEVSINKIEEALKKVQNQIEEKRKLLETFLKLSDEEKQKALFSLSFVEQALNGEALFPDLRVAGRTKFLTFNEVISNPPLLKFYKEAVPPLYELVREVAEKKGLKFSEAEAKKEKDLTTTENLGLIKFKYYPQVFDFADERVKETLNDLLEESLNPDELENVKETLEQLERLSEEGYPLKIVLLVERTFAELGGSTVFGFSPVLGVINEFGKQLAIFRIDLNKFYNRLIEKGVFDPKQKYEVVNPETDSEFVEKLLLNWKNHITDPAVVETFGVDAKDFREYVKDLKKKGAFGEKYARILKYAKEKGVFERAINNMFSFLDTEQVVKEALINDFKASGVVIPENLEKFIEEVIGIYKQYPLQFPRFRTKEDVERLKEENPLLYKRIKDIEVLRDGTETRVRELIEKYGLTDYAEEIIIPTLYSTLSAEASLKKRLYAGVIRYLFQLEEVLNGNVVSLKELREFFLEGLGIKPHQFDEAIRVVYKSQISEEKGHLAGWEMRSGKTVFALLTGYFDALTRGRDGILFPRSANVLDITYQIAEFVPQLMPNTVIYPVSNLEVGLREKFKGYVPFANEKTHPNPFVINNFKKVINRKLVSVDELVQSFPKDFEEFYSLAGEEGVKGQIDKEFIFVNHLPGFSERVKTALGLYLTELKTKGYILPPSKKRKEWKSIVDTLSSLGRQLEMELKRPRKKPFEFHIVPKTRIYGYSYRIDTDETVVEIKGRRANLKVKTNDENLVLEDGERISLSELNTEKIKELLGLPKEYIAILTETGLSEERLKQLVIRDDIVPEIAESIKTVDVGTVLTKDGKRIDLKVALIPGEFKDELALSPIWLEEPLTSLVESFVSGRSLKRFGEGEVYWSNGIEISLKFKKLPFVDGAEIEILTPEKEEVSGFADGERLRTLSEIPPEKVEIRGVRKATGRKIEWEVKVENGRVIERNTTLSGSARLRYEMDENTFSVVLDEADEAMNLNSNGYKSFFALARNTDNRVAMTGTPTSGYVDAPLALMGLVSDESFRVVKGKVEKAFDLFGAWELNHPAWDLVFWVYQTQETPADVIRTLAERIDSLIASNRYKEVKQLLAEMKVPEIILNDLKGTYNEAKGMVRILTEVAMQDLTDIDELKNFLLEKKQKGISKAPGTLDPVSFVSSLEGASVSFQTREGLKRLQNPNLKERKNFVDLERGLTAIISRMAVETPFDDKGKVEGDWSFLPHPGERKEKYHGSVFTDLRLAYDKMVQFYVDWFDYKAMVKEAISFLSSEFQRAVNPPTTPPLLRKFLEWVEEKSLFVMKEFPSLMEEFNGEETILELLRSPTKTGTTPLDAIENFLKEGTFDTFESERERKQAQLALLMVQFLAEKGEVRETAEGKKLIVAGVETDKEMSKTEFDLFKEAVEKFNEVLVTGEGFSKEVKLSFDGWETFYKPGKLSITVYPLSDKQDEVINVITNAGYVEYLDMLTREGQSFLVAPSRVDTVRYFLLQALNFARNREKPYVVIFRETDTKTKELVKEIDRDKLKEQGVTLKTFSTQAEIDLEVKKLSDAVKKGKLGLIVVAPAETIARGVDLSILDAIVIPGEVNASGKTFSQLLARGFNNTDKHEIDVYLFGTPNRFNYNPLEQSFTYSGGNRTAYIQYKLLKKDEFLSALMTGEIANVLDEVQSRIKAPYTFDLEFIENLVENRLNSPPNPSL